jgi:hypothetical protein
MGAEKVVEAQGRCLLDELGRSGIEIIEVLGKRLCRTPALGA